MFMIDALIKTIEAELDRLGLNKREFCERIQTEPQTYNNWRTRGVPSNKRSAIAKAMNWDFEALSEGRIEPATRTNNPPPTPLSGDGDEDVFAQIVEILIETQNEMIKEGVLSESYDAKALGKIAKQAYVNAMKTHELNPKAIKEGMRFAALLNT